MPPAAPARSETKTIAPRVWPDTATPPAIESLPRGGLTKRVLRNMARVCDGRATYATRGWGGRQSSGPSQSRSGMSGHADSNRIMQTWRRVIRRDWEVPPNVGTIRIRNAERIRRRSSALPRNSACDVFLRWKGLSCVGSRMDFPVHCGAYHCLCCSGALLHSPHR